MTEEEIMNVWTYISGKSEGLFESNVKCNFPVMFTEAILKLDRMNREWVSLTSEDIAEIERWVEFKEAANDRIPMQKLALYIEKKIKEKNNGTE